jgi:predicted nucleic acid-binding protein
VIVVDTNTIAYLYVQGQRTAQAEKVLIKDSEWAAPLLWRSEFVSVLAFCVRQKTLALDDAMLIAEEAQQFMRGGEFEVPPTQILRIASGSKCSSYEREFVALAQSLQVPLITSDKELLKDFPSIAISMEKFTT